MNRPTRWLLVMVAFGGLVLAVAGRVDLPRVWGFLAVMWSFQILAALVIDEKMIQERLRPGQHTHDPGVLLLLRVTAFSQIALALSDVGRLHWSDTVPVGLSVAGFVVLSAAFGFVTWALRVNRFFLPAIRIQSERRHHVIDTGPYRLVRHPGYAGAALAGPAGGLALGSWLGFALGLFLAAVLAYRARVEDRFLHDKLEGYRDFAARTRFRLVPGVWCALLALAVAAPAVAQDSAGVRPPQPPQTPEPPRPFVEGGVYDKPMLSRLMGRTAIGGYAEAHARWERVDGATEDAGFEARRWNIFTATQVSDVVRIGAELEFEDGGRDIKLEYAAIDVGIHPSLAIRAGMLLTPLGRFNLSHDSPRNEFTDRPLVSTDLLGVALSEPGLGVFGLFGLGGPARISYEVYATNGFHDGLINDSPDGTRVPLGRGNFEDNNASPAFAGRVAWSPRVGFEVGVSGHHGAYNVYSEEGNAVDERRNLTILVLDAEARVAGISLLGEAATTSLDVPPGLVGIYASRQRGLYVQAVRPFLRGFVATMPSSYFAAGVRLDMVDFDADLPGDSRRRVSFGLNFRPTQDTVLKLDYVRGRSRDRFNNPSDEAGVLFSVATYF
jgi:protein-S-isoprenylcysteine O-methyltransferase Ste14